MTDYSLGQAKLDVARLQSQMNNFLRVLRPTPTQIEALGTAVGFGDTGAPSFSTFTTTITYDDSGGTTDPDSESINSSRYCRLGDLVMWQFNISITRGSGDRLQTYLTLPVTAALVNQTGFAYSNITGTEREHKVRIHGTTQIAINHGTMTTSGVIRGFIYYEAA